MNTTHMKINNMVSRREMRRREIRDGKITAFAIIVALLAVMAVGSSCTTQRAGCYMSRGFSGTH